MYKSTSYALLRSLKRLIEPHVDEYVLLHSGYGGRQYVGKLYGVTENPNAEISNFHTLLSLRMDKEVERYEPAIGMSVHVDPSNVNWLRVGQNLGDGMLNLKEEDRLYALGKNVHLASFKVNKEPINPEDISHVIRLTGNVSEVKLLYDGAMLKIVK